MQHDRHVEGLFEISVWMECLRRAGVEPTRLTYEHPEVSYELNVFVGIRV